MRWGVFALAATGAVLIDGGAFGPQPWHEAAGASASARMEVASPAPVDRPTSVRVAPPTAAFSLFEDFPFGVAERGRGTAFPAPVDTPPIALDPDPQRFGPGRPAALLPDDLVFGPEQAPASVDIRGAVLETVLSDPLLRDLFGPGPLARFLAEVLSAARGEGAQVEAAPVAQGTPLPPARRVDAAAPGGGTAVMVFPAGTGVPRASPRPAGDQPAPSVADQVADRVPPEPNDPDSLLPPVNLPPVPPTGTIEPDAGAAPTEPVFGDGQAGSTAGPGRPPFGPPPGPWISLPSPELGPGSIPGAGPAEGLEPVPPPWTEPALGPAIAAVPEAASMATFAVGLLGLLALSRPRGALPAPRGG